ncbi:hypothetical protein BD560DRAFT_325196, partial [Blakeslea trispora]
DDLVLSICNELNQNRASASSQSEAAFINQSLMPFIKSILIDNDIKGLHYTFKYQIGSDFVKLMKQMKTSIDKQLQMGVQSPVSFGLLCEGFDCSFYKMVLAVEGVYIPVMIRELSLVKNRAGSINVPSVVETLVLVKQELHQLKSKLSQVRTSDKVEQKKLIKPSFKSNFKK